MATLCVGCGMLRRCRHGCGPWRFVALLRLWLCTLLRHIMLHLQLPFLRWLESALRRLLPFCLSLLIDLLLFCCTCLVLLLHGTLLAGLLRGALLVEQLCRTLCIYRSLLLGTRLFCLEAGLLLGILLLLSRLLLLLLRQNAGLWLPHCFLLQVRLPCLHLLQRILRRRGLLAVERLPLAPLKLWLPLPKLRFVCGIERRLAVEARLLIRHRLIEAAISAVEWLLGMRQLRRHIYIVFDDGVRRVQELRRAMVGAKELLPVLRRRLPLRDLRGQGGDMRFALGCKFCR